HDLSEHPLALQLATTSTRPKRLLGLSDSPLKTQERSIRESYIRVDDVVFEILHVNHLRAVIFFPRHEINVIADFHWMNPDSSWLSIHAGEGELLVRDEIQVSLECSEVDVVLVTSWLEFSRFHERLSVYALHFLGPFIRSFYCVLSKRGAHR